MHPRRMGSGLCLRMGECQSSRGSAVLGYLESLFRAMSPAYLGRKFCIFISVYLLGFVLFPV